MSERAAAALRIQRAGERFGLSSDRELEILRLLLEDKTLAQIGRELCIARGHREVAPPTASTRKAQVSGRKELAAAVAAVEGNERRGPRSQTTSVNDPAISRQGS